MERFEDEKGSVTIAENYIERDRSSEPGFDPENALDKIHFSRIDKVELQSEAEPPCVEVKTEEGWRKMSFDSIDSAKTVFNRLKYNLSVYREKLS